MFHHLNIRQKIFIMVAVMSGLFLAALDQSIVGTALPRIVSEFNGLSQLSWVVTSYLLTSTIAVPIGGKLSDIFGRRRILLIGISMFVLGSLLTGLSWNMTSLIGFRAFQGIGGGLLFASTFSVIGDLFAPAERAKWQGVFGAVFGLSSVIGPLLGGFLTDRASWRWCFIINVPVGLLSYALIFKLLPKIVSDRAGKTIDYLGAALLSTGLGALLLALSWGGRDYPWASWQIIGLGITALVAGVLFVQRERKTNDPIVPMHIFSNGILRVALITMFLVGTAMFGAIIYLPLFAQTVLGTTATNSGVILMPLVLALATTSAINGQVVSRTGRYKKIVIFGAFLTTAALFWLASLSVHSSHLQLVLRMIPLGIGIGILMPTFNLVAQNAAPQQELGIVTSTVQLFRGIGSTVGVAVMGTYLNHSLSNHLANLGDSAFTKLMSQNGQNIQHVNADTIQQYISNQGQAQVMQTIANLPAMMRDEVQGAYMQFLHVARDALAVSITSVFFIGACLMAIACITVLFLKEIPLRKHNDDAPAH